MLSQRTIETSVGLFLLAAFIAFVVLAFRVSGLTSFLKRIAITSLHSSMKLVNSK